MQVIPNDLQSVWLVGESLLQPHDGVSQQSALVLFLHGVERASRHFLLQEVKQLDLQLGVELGLLENVEFGDDLVEGVNLDLVFQTGGFGGGNESKDELEHFIINNSRNKSNRRGFGVLGTGTKRSIG